jgi:hypothetical protein
MRGPGLACSKPCCRLPCRPCQVALVETGNVGLEVATEWLFNAPEGAEAEERPSGGWGGVRWWGGVGWVGSG